MIHPGWNSIHNITISHPVYKNNYFRVWNKKDNDNTTLSSEYLLHFCLFLEDVYSGVTQLILYKYQSHPNNMHNPIFHGADAFYSFIIRLVVVFVLLSLTMLCKLYFNVISSVILLIQKPKYNKNYWASYILTFKRTKRFCGIYYINHNSVTINIQNSNKGNIIHNREVS